jgi:hypothetical protein
MEYRGVQYAVVRTMSPNGWRWTVKRGHHDKSGSTPRQDEAIRLAKKFIDELIKTSERKEKA